ncbi:MAG: rhodanese-like domain-containing protein [Bacteroidota bacterium]|nr:rhodanese-like domain-containing protein [Bacteroidota bacterium]
MFLNRLFGTGVQDDTIRVLSPEAFREAVQNKKVQLIDVRTKAEFSQGAIKNAVNLDFFQPQQLLNGVKKLDNNKPLYLYCRSGNRSQKAARLLKQEGFTEIYDLQGGIGNY